MPRYMLFRFDVTKLTAAERGVLVNNGSPPR